MLSAPDVSADEEMQNKLTSLNDQLDKYRSTTVTYTFGESTEVLDSRPLIPGSRSTEKISELTGSSEGIYPESCEYL